MDEKLLLRAMLQDYTCFESLAKPVTDELVALATSREIPGETVIVRAGTSPSGLFLVQRGLVKTYQQDDHRREYIFCIHQTGDCFNLVSTLDHQVNPNDIAALTAIRTWHWEHTAIASLIDRYPDFALAVTRYATRQMRQLFQQVRSLALDSVLCRLALLLLNEPHLMSGRVSRVTLAAYLGTTPETLSRYLSQLEQMGAIHYDRRHVEVRQRSLIEQLVM